MNLAEFRDIEGFPLYMISEFGQIIRKECGTPISTPPNAGGYEVVGLYHNGQRSMKRVNVLVARAFIPNPDNLPEVHHKDENKRNNHVSNLQWTTHAENCSLSFAKTYTVVSPDSELITFTNVNKFCRKHGFSQGTFSQMLRGERRQYRGWALYG